jgi:hypothetical protein
MPRLFSYLMTHDSGFAPNPFFGCLTLATCMTEIRRTKKVGDWVAGFASKALVKKCNALGLDIPYQGLIYLMEIGEILPLHAYFHDHRFQQKKAIPLGSGNIMLERGDNIYHLDATGNFQQLENDNHDEGELLKDTQGKNALIAKQFYYFGRDCPVPNASWRSLNVRVPDRYIAYGCESDGFALEKMTEFLHEQCHNPGLLGRPCIWDAIL